MIELAVGNRLAASTTRDMDNPYASPAEYASPALEAGQYARATGWRLVPAAASFVIGAASFVFGLFAVGVMTYLLSTHQATEGPPFMIAGCSLYLGFGASWMIAGWYYWKRRYRRGLIASVFGVLIPIVLFATLGF
jgi:hypothetical protein